MSSQIIVDCLLPTSIIVPITCQKDISLDKLKINLWEEAKKYPQFHSLAPASAYVFVGITQDAEQEEFWDENRQLCDLRLFSPILKVVEHKECKADKIFYNDISIILGHSLADLEYVQDFELQHFRRNILKVIDSATHIRHFNGYESVALYYHPPLLQNISPDFAEKYIECQFFIAVWKNELDFTKFEVPSDIYPSGIIIKAAEQLFSFKNEDATADIVTSYVLKFCGINEYLLANKPIIQYKLIQECLYSGKTPQLSIISRTSFYSSLVSNEFLPSYSSDFNREESIEPISLWHDYMNGPLKINILQTKNLSLPNRGEYKVFVRAGLFHGAYKLAPVLQSCEISDDVCVWDEWLQFDINMQELPRATKICFSLNAKQLNTDKAKRKDKEELITLGWTNISLFDFRGRICHGKKLLPLESFPKGIEGFVYPLGYSNSSVAENNHMLLEIGFESRLEQEVLFPDILKMFEYGRYITRLQEKKNGQCNLYENSEETEYLIKTFAFSEFFDVEKQLFLDSLPDLLKMVKWESRDHVSLLYLLLLKFPLVSVETALELLQCSTADAHVRSLAVKSLEKKINDEQLCMYLMHFTQLLIHEPYLDSSLLRFLLKRALTNARIGHYFFWYLRSQQETWPVRWRVSAILESYCRGLGNNRLKSLVKQIEAVDALSSIAEVVREKRCDPSKEGKHFLMDLLKKPSYKHCLQHIISPLNPSHSLGCLRFSECKILDSARRTVCLVWDNADTMASLHSLYYGIILKAGDDLRQDMLTLQVFEIMTQIWKNSGLDLPLTPYLCLATGKKRGLIEMVLNAKTVYSIQKRATFAAMQFDSSQLFKWIRDKNKGPKLIKAINNFTKSCAGYCVATFVLGIGDRHPDNIMVHEEGFIFHIDFGHFLGNFKRKFGVNRERVPFVLTQDFLKVIACGADSPKDSTEFQSFQELCGKAYLALRNHSRVMLLMFSLLISTGIPDLQSDSCLAYLRKALAVELSEEDALKYFQNQFHEAYGGAWTTKLDWFFHSMKHR